MDVDTALAAGWPLVNAEDLDVRPLEVRDSRIGDFRTSNPTCGIYPGTAVVVASPGRVKFATVTAISRGDSKATLSVWTDEYQPEWQTEARRT